MNLHYRAHAQVEDLGVNECTIHRASGSTAARWWQLWFRVARETDGVVEDFAVPVEPNGAYREDGPGGKTWGLSRAGAGVWQISPSIDVKEDSRDAHGPNEHPGQSAWHQTPAIVDVPEGERWQLGPP